MALVASMQIQTVEAFEPLPTRQHIANDRTYERLRECGKLRVREALDRLQDSQVAVAPPTYVSLLQQCGDSKALLEGKRVHAHIIKSGYDGDTFLGNHLVQMYGKCGSLEDARLAFEGIPGRNVFSWTTMMAAYARSGHLQEARDFFERMPQQNVVAWTSMLLAYAKNGQLQEARGMFDRMPSRSVVSWNTMITAYAQCGHFVEALEIFARMNLEGMKPSEVTFLGVLDACASLLDLAEGTIVHACIAQSGFLSDVRMGNSLVNMYGKCGCLENARSTFDKMPERDVVSWTAMVAAYAQNGHIKDAFNLFQLMDLEGVEPNEVTFVTIIDICADLRAVEEGKMIHASIAYSEFQSEVSVGNALVNMYGKFGSLQDARNLFDKIHKRDVISWSALMTAFCQNGHGKESLELFRRMDLEGVKPDDIAFITALDACGSLVALTEGRIVHQNIQGRLLMKDNVLGAVVNMYGKCGSLQDARKVFDGLPERDVVLWTAMMSAYTQNGNGKEALVMFQLMDLEGLKPNASTYKNALHACATIGALAEGKLVHACVVDKGLHLDTIVATAIVGMYGKCGSLENVEMVFSNVPQHDLVLCNAVLAAYAQNGYGKLVVERFCQMQLEGITPNEVTFISILCACSHAGSMNDAWQQFISMTSDFNLTPVVDHYGCMIDLLSRAGRLSEAQSLIKLMPFEPTAVTWTALLGACNAYGETNGEANAAEHVLGLDPKNSSPYVLMSNTLRGMAAGT